MATAKSKSKSTKSVAKKKTTAKVQSSKSATAKDPKPQAPVQPKKSSLHGVVCHDHQRRTCIEVGRFENAVDYIELNIEDGLDVQTTGLKEFDSRYKPTVDYPVERAAALYISYARTIGASKEAMQKLGAYLPTKPTEKEIEMATKKKTSKAAAKPAPAAKKAAAKKAPAKAAKKAAPAKKEKAATGEKRDSAANLFQTLIREGKLTDDQIFAKVQTKFGLDDNKRSYVAWYRNHLRKQGEKVPDGK